MWEEFEICFVVFLVEGGLFIYNIIVKNIITEFDGPGVTLCG